MHRWPLPQVEQDLLQNHGRKSSRATLRDLADVVGSVAQIKKEKWTYDIPELPKPVFSGHYWPVLTRYAWLKEKLHSLKHNEGEAKRLHRELEKASPGNNRIASLEKLLKARTYFKNHWQQMIYPEALEKKLPTGSGVTEAACKTLVKQRMCRSGMRWKEQGASMLLTLRALVCSTGYWDEFWSKMSHYGYPVAHNLPLVH